MPPKSPPKPKTAAQVSFALAATLAATYAELGLHQYNELAKVFAQRTATTPAAFTGGAVSAATVLALAAELYSKCLVYQRKLVYPQVHHIRDILDHLPVDVVESVAKRYDELLAKKPNLLKFEVGLDATHAPPARAGALSFEQAITEISEMFVKLRYLHESFDSGFQLVFDFHSLLLVINALDLEIAAFNGPIKIEVGAPRPWKSNQGP